MASAVLLLLLLLLLLLQPPGDQVTVVSSVTSCKPQKCCTDNLCHPCCPAGCHVSKAYWENKGTVKCVPCEPGTFMDNPNMMESCFLCYQCSYGKSEVVSHCSLAADQQCQCRKGYYCDTENCAEHCFSCSSCPKGIPVVWECNAMANTVCSEADPVLEKRNHLYLNTCILPLLGLMAIYYLL